MKKFIVSVLLVSQIHTSIHANSQIFSSIMDFARDHALTTAVVGLAMMPVVTRAVEKVRTRGKAKVGLIEIKGAIVSSEKYLPQIEAFKNDDTIAGVFIMVNSPGGISGVGETLYSELLLLKERKPVVVWVESMCGSAAYHISCASHYIVSNNSAIIGSIGSYMQFNRYDGLPIAFNLGVNGSIAKVIDQTVYAGEFKRVGDPYKKFTDKERAYLQVHVNETYMNFANHVAHSRGLDMADLKKWGEGQIFGGDRALELGLIDEVGSKTFALQLLYRLMSKKRGMMFRSGMHFVEKKSLMQRFTDLFGFRHNTPEIAHIVAEFCHHFKSAMKKYDTVQDMQVMN